MSAVATRSTQDLTKLSGCLGFKPNGNNKNSSNSFQRPNHDRKNMTLTLGCGELDIVGEECSTPRQVNTLPFRPNFPNLNLGRRQNLNGQQGGNTTLQSSPSNDEGGIHINRELRVAGAQTDSDLTILIPGLGILGRANETDAEIDVVISKALIDSGAMISMMSKDFCYEQGYEIQSLENLVPIEGSGGPVFLIWVSPTTTKYLQRVPIQLGSQVIDQVISHISEKELQSLSQSWKTAYVSTIISKAICIKWSWFNLDQIKGSVVISEEVTIPTSWITVVKGMTTITGHHVFVESSPKCMNVFILGNTSELKPGNSDIEVVI